MADFLATNSNKKTLSLIPTGSFFTTTLVYAELFTGPQAGILMLYLNFAIVYPRNHTEATREVLNIAIDNNY